MPSLFPKARDFPINPDSKLGIFFNCHALRAVTDLRERASLRCSPIMA